MGVDISHIIKHDFKKVHDTKASMEFCKQTIAILNKNLHINLEEKDFELYCDDHDKEITFRLPVYDLQFTLHNGFWEIDSFCHYCQIVMHHGDYFWLRELTFDIAKCLGEKEAWYAEEFYTWNGEGCACPETTFDQWYEKAMKLYGKPIPEFNQQSIMAQGDVHIPDYEPIYHDSFKECIEKYNALQDRLHGYKLLGLEIIGNGYLRCEKDGGLYLVNIDTFELMFNEPIESMLQSLNGPEFIVKKGCLSAVYDMNGKQLTDYVTGEFDWKWAPYDPKEGNTFKRIIYNIESNIELNVDS